MIFSPIELKANHPGKLQCWKSSGGFFFVDGIYNIATKNQIIEKMLTLFVYAVATAKGTQFLQLGTLPPPNPTALSAI